MNKLGFSRKGINKLPVVIVAVIIIVVALVAGFYFYNSQLTPSPKPTSAPSASPSSSTSPTPVPLSVIAALRYSNLYVNQTEAWPGQLVNVSVDVTNTGSESISYSLPFFVNGQVAQNVQVQVAGGATETIMAALKESSLGSYSVTAGGQSDQFTIVPTGEYTLHYITTVAGFSFTLDNTPEVCPFSELVSFRTAYNYCSNCRKNSSCRLGTCHLRLFKLGHRKH